MRLLGYWILFMILTVAFVPAFALIYSPATIPPQPCPECPDCPEWTCPPPPECPVVECPECPTCPECPQVLRFYPLRFLPVTVFRDRWDPQQGFMGFMLYTPPAPANYKYFLLLNLPRHKIAYEVLSADWLEDEIYIIDFRRLNATHSYAFTRDPLLFVEMHLSGLSQADWDRIFSRQVYLIVVLVEDHVTLSEILQHL